MIQVHIGKAILWGTIVIVLSMAAGNLLYLNPYSRALFEQYKGHPSIKPVEAFGGEVKWVALMSSSGIYIGALQILFFLLMAPMLPRHWLLRGILFGLLIWGIRALPEAFNQWLLFTYPTPLVLVQLINTLIGTLLIFGLLFSYLVERMGIITRISQGVIP